MNPESNKRVKLTLGITKSKKKGVTKTTPGTLETSIQGCASERLKRCSFLEQARNEMCVEMQVRLAVVAWRKSSVSTGKPITEMMDLM